MKGDVITPEELKIRELVAQLSIPIPMILHCPNCHKQHIDTPETDEEWNRRNFTASHTPSRWYNPPHKSHLCAGCGLVWRPADIYTTGVAKITSHGKADTIVFD